MTGVSLLVRALIQQRTAEVTGGSPCPRMSAEGFSSYYISVNRIPCCPDDQ